MLGLSLDSADPPQQIRHSDIAERVHLNHLWMALGQRPGLVHNDSAHACQRLERGGVLEQHAPLRAKSGADHDGHRGGEAERVGAGDDDDRDREEHRFADRAAA